ncbi:MAG TPA: hypothetical protein VNW29_06355 [Candidatus Sulfotelmatobacter sp.]|jgi:hypothetical protein|nr:hypothetical protein [Candidatus Sulfotelmatobacter sp.]
MPALIERKPPRFTLIATEIFPTKNKESARNARKWIISVLETVKISPNKRLSRLVADRKGDMELLASELCTNADRYGSSQPNLPLEPHDASDEILLQDGFNKPLTKEKKPSPPDHKASRAHFVAGVGVIENSAIIIFAADCNPLVGNLSNVGPDLDSYAETGRGGQLIDALTDNYGWVKSGPEIALIKQETRVPVEKVVWGEFKPK